MLLCLVVPAIVCAPAGQDREALERAVTEFLRESPLFGTIHGTENLPLLDELLRGGRAPRGPKRLERDERIARRLLPGKQWLGLESDAYRDMVRRRLEERVNEILYFGNRDNGTNRSNVKLIVDKLLSPWSW